MSASRDRLVVRTLRCGRSNPGSNPGLGILRTQAFAGPYRSGLEDTAHEDGARYVASVV